MFTTSELTWLHAAVDRLRVSHIPFNPETMSPPEEKALSELTALQEKVSHALVASLPPSQSRDILADALGRILRREDTTPEHHKAIADLLAA